MKEYTISISYNIDVIADNEQSAINIAVNKIREHKLISKLLVQVIDKRELTKQIAMEDIDNVQENDK